MFAPTHIFVSGATDQTEQTEPLGDEAGIFGLPNKVVGVAAVLIALVLNVVRKKYFQGLSVQMGSTKRLFAFSVALGAAFVSPFAAYSYYMVCQSFAPLSCFFNTFVTHRRKRLRSPRLAFCSPWGSLCCSLLLSTIT